jgi:NAD(P)-dependent dehydrogenase (short-subunit alcohol dehydrogenase family)
MSQSPADPPKQPPKRAAAIAGATGRTVRGYTADVQMSQDITRLADELASAFGPVDILVNNAGINVRGPSDQLAEADWDAVIDTNLKGPFLCARTFGPLMAARGWGRVINLGSILSVIGLPGRAPYAASKAGIVNLTRVLALEWAERGVTVNAICPGPFGTEMNKPLLEDPRSSRPSSRRSRWDAGVTCTRSPASRYFSPLTRRHSSPAARCSSMAAGQPSRGARLAPRAGPAGCSHCHDHQSLSNVCASRSRRRVRTAPQSDLA